MKTFNASDMAHKRAKIFEAAKDDGCVIERKNTNGEVIESFVMVDIECWAKITDSQKTMLNLLGVK